MTRPLTLPLLALTFGLPSLFAQDEKAMGEWTYLFGEDAELEEFYIDSLEEVEPSELFEFTDERGLLIKGADHPEGYLQTLDEYENYELEFEWRWPSKKGGQAGIILHSSNYPYMGLWPEGIVLELDHRKAGDLRLFGAELEVSEERQPKLASERDQRARLKEAEKPLGHWNQMRIHVSDDAIKVFLNDELVNEGANPSLTSGFIAFQAEESDIELREVRVREQEE